MASLVACVKDEVQIEDWPLGFTARCILDNVQCESLNFDMSFGFAHYEEFPALVRAMRTRVRRVCLPFSLPERLLDELIKYDGKGKCEQVTFLGMDNHVEPQEKQGFKLWAKSCKWQVLADEEDILLLKRKES